MKTKYNIILAVAALLLPLTWANAATDDFFWNGSTNNEVGKSPTMIDITAGGTVSLVLSIVIASGTTGDTGGIDYWLSQASGSGHPFSITNRDYTNSAYPDPSATLAQVTASTDTRSNSANSATSDGVPDNQINPQNAWDLGSSDTAAGPKGVGTWLVATFTFSIAPSATGTYELRTFDYTGFGIGDITPLHQADIFLRVVPEPATLSLLGLGGLGCLGLTLLRARHRVRS
jgi:hypothetical protein